MLNEVQKITLCDTLRTAGLKERQIEDIQLLLRFKPHRVQLAMYYRLQGMTFENIADLIGASKTQTIRYVYESCDDIIQYIRS